MSTSFTSFRRLRHHFGIASWFVVIAIFILNLGGFAWADMASVNQAVWQVKYHVSDTQINSSTWLDADDDGDGIKNKDELAAGTDPFSASKTIKVSSISKSGANVTIQFPTEDGKRYRVQKATSLTSPSWTIPSQTPPEVVGTGAAGQIVLTFAAGTFYRVIVDDKDTDLDGLSDWAEKIAGYNPNSAMTDGRTPDGTALSANVAAMNQVNVTVAKPSATQPGDSLTPPVDVGSVTISRGLTKLGSLSAGVINVNLQKSGTATEGTDYDGLPSVVNFPAATSQIVLTVNPKFNSARRTNVTAIVKALTGTGYTLGSTTTASVVVNPAGLANGTGLTGQYFNSSSSTYSPTQTTIFGGTPQMTQVDPTIDFNGIASIVIANPCVVTTVRPHGLVTGTPVTIFNVSGGTFSPAINGTWTATVTGASTFTVPSNCTVAPTSLLIASVCGMNGITAVSTTGNPCTITTKVPHNFGTNGTNVPVAINWLNGVTSTAAMNATLTATVTGASTFTVPVSNTTAPSSSQLAVGTISGPAGVNGWGATSGPTGMSSPATGGAWSVRWTGQVLPRYSETYTFDVRSNGSAKLWINGQLLVDRWAVAVSTQEYVNSITLKAGTLYDIQIDYWQSAPSASSTGFAEARLYWWSPSQTKQIVPQGRLFPAPALSGKLTAITSNLSAVGYVSEPFSFNVTTPNISSTIGATTFALDTASGPLPPGLTLSASTGAITGTPTAAGTYNIAVNATNVAAAAVTGSSIVNITIYPTGSVTRETLVGSVFTANGTIPTVDDDTNYASATSRRLRGYIVPPKTGNYYFWLAANNTAELWISNDGQYINRVRRATVAASTGNKIWNAAVTQRTPWLYLVAGQKYYFDVLHTAPGGADDYISMGWCQDDIGTIPSTSTAPNGAGTRTSIPNGGAAVQGYPLSGTVPSYIFQPYDYPSASAANGDLYSANLGPQGSSATNASGSANLRVDPSGTFATLHFTYQNLGSPRTNYHLHTDAFSNHPQGEIIYDIDDVDAFHPELRTADGGYIWNFGTVGTFANASQILTAIQGGKVYLNVHSVNFPAGEIRGNLNLVSGSQTPPDPTAYAEPTGTDSPSNPAHSARFLNQATFGASPSDVAYLSTHTFSQWIDDQLPKTASHSSSDVVNGLTADINNAYPSTLFTNAWWKYSITGQDQLRQRLAFALSEIMVISWNNDTGPLQRNGRILADYYDQLVDYCLPTSGLADSGNFRGLLKAVTLTPAMGLYLDMRANQKGDDSLGRHPNENYAREIMQLFSVGLNRAWDDGKFVLDSDANLVPTYNQTSILGMAELFTGWNYAQPNQSNGRAPTNFGPGSDYLNPMVLVPSQHDITPKLLLDNVVSPGATGQTPRVSISSISGSPATVTTATDHGLTSGDAVTIAAANGTYTTGGPINASFVVTVTGARTFTVPVTCTVAGTASGTVTGATVLMPTNTAGSFAAVTGSQADSAGTTLPHPYDQYGLVELDIAIDNIVNNDNVAPYICRQLIQRLVTSNPSAGYLYRVVQKFKNNGAGVRGDLAAVVRQILLDGEARITPAPTVTSFGKQREPMLRLTGPARAFPAAAYTGSYTQLAGVSSNKFRIVTSAPNDFSTSFPVSLNFRGNYTPAGQTLLPSNTVPTSTTYSVGSTLGIASTTAVNGTGLAISSITTGDPCTVNTTVAHGLNTGDTVTISGVSGGAFSPTIIGAFQVTVLSTTSFTVASNNTIAATSVASALATPNFTQITTVQNHGLTTGNSVTISGISGGSFTPTINGSFNVTVIDATNYTVPVKQTTAPTSVTSAQIVGANTFDVNAPEMINVAYSQTAGTNLMTVSTTGPATKVAVPGTVANISDISIGNPCVVTTSTAHKLATGDLVSIAGITDGAFGTAINSTFVATVTDTTHFSVPVECTVAPNVYAAGTTVSTKRILSRVYLAFLTQTTAGGAAIPADGIYDLQSNGSSTFTVVTGDTPATARAGNVIIPKLASSYTPLSGGIIQFNVNVNHTLAVGNPVWIDAPVVTNPMTDAQYVVTTLVDEDHFKTSSQPASTSGGVYPNASGSNNGVTIWPLVPPPTGRSGVVTINQSTYSLGSTESTLTQSPLNSPTVFNYFFPNYRYPGTLAANNLDSPEFQLSTDTNVVNLSNSIVNMFIGTSGGNGNVNGLSSFNNGGGSVVMDISPYMTSGQTSNGAIPALVDTITNLLVGGPLDAANRTIIINFVANTTNFPFSTPTPSNVQMRDRVRAIIHLIINSAEYAAQK